MGLIGFLLNLVLSALSVTVVVGIVLAMIRQSFHPRWANTPFARMMILLALTVCAPMRRLMERFGIPTHPLDFSPMLTVFVIQVTQQLVRAIT